MTPSDTPMPANLHIAVTSRASTVGPLPERVEQKFFITPERMVSATALLRRTCRPDPEHANGQVNSLYFDTHDLEEHSRSDAGDFAKDKIRIRWYGGEFDPHRSWRDGSGTGIDGQDGASMALTDSSGVSIPSAMVPVWLERKTRRGFASTKQRLTLEVPARMLAPEALGRGIVPVSLLRDTMVSFGFFPDGRLCPVIAISYWRHRFVEPVTGFRISIDARIRSSLVMPGVGHGERGLELPGAVVEVKGPVFDLPPALRPLAEIGSSWTRYSKYSSSLDGHAATMGSVSRLWPSGMMQKEPPTLGRVTTSGGGSRAKPSWAPGSRRS